MRYLSVCSGIEAASVAWEGLGWTPLAFSEIEAFPRVVLQHHYPDVPLHGDFTELRKEPWIKDADVLVGGAPLVPVAYDMRGRKGGSQFEGPHETANIRAANGGSSRSYVAQQWAVRRLTPRECERLQGFPDDYTLVSVRGKPAADGPRYKALGNSMAVPVMRWIGSRIVKELQKEEVRV
jgi:site-specific DNA-cytosine methylase